MILKFKNADDIEIVGLKFAYDGCHKIYILEDEEDIKDALELNYIIYPMNKLPVIWYESCPLKFISNWKLTKMYISQDDNEKYVDIDIKMVN